jgi:hypothetical protein
MKLVHLGLTAIAICLMSGLVSLAFADDAKLDLNGSWTWSYQGRNGNTMTSTLKLKQDGDTITGSVVGMNGQSTDIKDAKLAGDDLTFKVVRKRNDQEMIINYDGKVTADEIKGKSTVDMNGTPSSRDWDAKRADASTTQPATQPAQ